MSTNYFLDCSAAGRERVCAQPGVPTMPNQPIGPYSMQPPKCVEYDPHTVEVARLVEKRITAVLPTVRIEHIGSTSVPGCAGKGIVDLMVIYPDGQLEAVKETLKALGFQPQTVGHIFPESRPMRVGSITHKRRTYRLHVHVIAESSSEVTTLRTFRERLRADPELMAAYVARKQAIVAAGVTDPQLYTRMKSEFIQVVLD